MSIIITLLHNETSEKFLLQTTKTLAMAVGNGPTGGLAGTFFHFGKIT